MASAVVFSLNGEQYGVPTVEVQEVMPVQRITGIPNTEESVLGITNVRGRVVPVVDLRRRLGFTAVPPGPASRIVLVQRDGAEVGMLVDAVQGVVPYEENAVEKSPVEEQGKVAHLRGLIRRGDEIVLVLDLEAVLRRHSATAV